MGENVFSSLPHVELLADGRAVRLLSDFTFTDSGGLVWESLKNDIADGSSIPRMFWSLIGSPFVGKHRFASIVHDKYCKLREKSGRTSEQAHRMYYDACIASGVSKYKAKLMYRAIRLGGPKW